MSSFTRSILLLLLLLVVFAAADDNSGEQQLGDTNSGNDNNLAQLNLVARLRSKMEEQGLAPCLSDGSQCNVTPGTNRDCARCCNGYYVTDPSRTPDKNNNVPYCGPRPCLGNGATCTGLFATVPCTHCCSGFKTVQCGGGGLIAYTCQEKCAAEGQPV